MSNHYNQPSFSELFAKWKIPKKKQKYIYEFAELAQWELDDNFPEWQDHEDAFLFVERDYYVRLMLIKNYSIKKCLESFKKFWKFRVET